MKYDVGGDDDNDDDNCHNHHHDYGSWRYVLCAPVINDKSFIYDETRDDLAATFNFRFIWLVGEPIYYTHCCTTDEYKHPFVPCS